MPHELSSLRACWSNTARGNMGLHNCRPPAPQPSVRRSQIRWGDGQWASRYLEPFRAILGAMEPVEAAYCSCRVGEGAPCQTTPCKPLFGTTAHDIPGLA